MSASQEKAPFPDGKNIEPMEATPPPPLTMITLYLCGYVMTDRGIEVYQGKLILYGYGDFLNDYEGIRGYEHYRGDLSLTTR